MSISRRHMLSLVGGGVILAAGGGAGGFALTRAPEKALAPWRAAGAYPDPRMRALSYAILAPNPHNRQPWLVDLRASGRVTLHRDEARALPHTDPHARQLTIGLGCFLEQMIVAASRTGHAVALTLFPEGENGPVAHADFKAGGSPPDALSAHIMERRSCKEPFRDDPVPDAAAERLGDHAAIIRAPEDVAALRDLTWDAWMVEAQTPRAHNESVELMRIGKAEINAEPDGISLRGPFLEALALAGVLTREAMRDPTSSAYRQGVERYRAMLAATPAYAVVTTPGNSRVEQIAAGRRWLRLNLAATALGLALHPVSQALQEYPEMAESRRRAHSLLAPDGGRVQMLGRLGYGPSVARTPRWPLESRILNG